MKTLTKLDLATRISEQTSLKKVSMAQYAVEVLIEIHKQYLYERKSIYFANCGRIAVRLKSPRIGRNPKTGVECVIAERHSITFTGRKSQKAGKLNKTSLTAALLNRGYSQRDTEDLISVWYEFIRSILTGEYRIEFRGLGVFYPKVVRAGTRKRNPKTGESIVTEGGIAPAFRCSQSLRKAIDKQYL